MQLRSNQPLAHPRDAHFSSSFIAAELLVVHCLLPRNAMSDLANPKELLRCIYDEGTTIRSVHQEFFGDFLPCRGLAIASLAVVIPASPTRYLAYSRVATPWRIAKHNLGKIDCSLRLFSTFQELRPAFTPTFARQTFWNFTLFGTIHAKHSIVMSTNDNSWLCSIRCSLFRSHAAVLRLNH
jgi:hypothetical protein